MAKQKINIENLTNQMQKQFEKDILTLIEFQDKAVDKFLFKNKNQPKKMDGLHKIIANG